MIRQDTLFLALTRPALFWGVPLEAFLLNAFLTFFVGVELQGPTLWRSPFMFWLMGIPVHCAMRELTAWDYHWSRTLVLWARCSFHRVLGSIPARPIRTPAEIVGGV